MGNELSVTVTLLSGFDWLMWVLVGLGVILVVRWVIGIVM